MFDGPLVSICIPAYNSERYVESTLESVLDQSYTNIEVIVIDDCSQDETWEKLQAFTDPRLKLSRNESNLGAEKNWNACLEKASGKYIQFLPSDDELYPDAISQRAAILDNPVNRDLVFVYSARDIVNADGKKVMTALLSKGGRRDRLKLVSQNVTRGMNVIGEPGCVLFRSETARKAGGFSARFPYIIDLNYWVRLLEYGDAWCIPEPQCTFRLSGQNWSIRLKSQRRDNYLEFIDYMALLSWTKISRFEVFAGKTRTYLNEVLRVLFYKFVLRV